MGPATSAILRNMLVAAHGAVVDTRVVAPGKRGGYLEIHVFGLGRHDELLENACSIFLCPSPDFIGTTSAGKADRSGQEDGLHLK